MIEDRLDLVCLVDCGCDVLSKFSPARSDARLLLYASVTIIDSIYTGHINPSPLPSCVSNKKYRYWFQEG